MFTFLWAMRHNSASGICVFTSCFKCFLCIPSAFIIPYPQCIILIFIHIIHYNNKSIIQRKPNSVHYDNLNNNVSSMWNRFSDFWSLWLYIFFFLFVARIMILSQKNTNLLRVCWQMVLSKKLNNSLSSKLPNDGF